VSPRTGSTSTRDSPAPAAPGPAWTRPWRPRSGDTLVVPKLDRLARSVPDARDIGDTLVARGVRLSLGGSIYDPADPMSKMFFNMLAVFAEFEADLLKMRTREGMAVARSRGRLKGKQPKLSARQKAELVRMHGTGEYTIADLMEVFSVGRATVYRTLGRAGHEVKREPDDWGPAAG
jgi:DNA invertase Pin-like site-specific DNA recombinase